MFGSHLETWEGKRILSGSEGEVAGLGGPGLELRERRSLAPVQQGHLEVLLGFSRQKLALRLRAEF